jgi:integrase
MASELTVKTYNQAIKKLQELNLDLKDTNLFINFVAKLKDSYSPSSVAVWTAGIKSYLKSQGYDLSQYKEPQLPSKSRGFLFSLDKDQVKTVIEALKSKRPYKDTCCIALMLASGLRVSEAVSILYDNLEIHDGNIVIKVTGKGNKQRVVVCMNFANWFLRTYLLSDERDQYSKWLFPRDDDPTKHITANRIQSFIIRFRKRLNMPRLTCHTLRRTFATLLEQSGVQPMTIAKLLGHSKLDTTLLYVSPNIKQVSEIINNVWR